MTWTLTNVTRAPHSDKKLALLLQSVTMEFTEFDSNGVATGKTRTYTEPNVSDVSDEGIARLARDQMRQLEKIAQTPTGAVDLNTIRALVSPPVVDPTPQELALQAFHVKRARLGDLRALVVDGVLDDTDAEYVALLMEVRRDFAAIRSAGK
jgi:hypothetical protein